LEVQAGAAPGPEPQPDSDRADAPADALTVGPTNARERAHQRTPLKLPSREELQYLVNAAVDAAGQARDARGAPGTLLGLGQISVQVEERGAQGHTARGYTGPPGAELDGMLEKTKTPDLGNIEIHYRLGLACVAETRLERAKRAFETVEEISPGYRDAAQRLEELAAMASAPGKVTMFGGEIAEAAGRRYTLIKELGRGGMAVVYKAHDVVLNRDVAMKFIADEASGNPLFMDFFKREARAAASLNHPNIVTIFDVGVLNGRAFICMELVDGTPVESLIEQRGRLEVLEALDITEQMLDALEYAHAQRVVHRDIKPANVMKAPASPGRSIRARARAPSRTTARARGPRLRCAALSSARQILLAIRRYGRDAR
jgi:hypothetical protein